MELGTLLFDMDNDGFKKYFCKAWDLLRSLDRDYLNYMANEAQIRV